VPDFRGPTLHSVIAIQSHRFSLLFTSPMNLFKSKPGTPPLPPPPPRPSPVVFCDGGSPLAHPPLTQSSCPLLLSFFLPLGSAYFRDIFPHCPYFAWMTLFALSVLQAPRSFSMSRRGSLLVLFPFVIFWRTTRFSVLDYLCTRLRRCFFVAPVLFVLTCTIRSLRQDVHFDMFLSPPSGNDSSYSPPSWGFLPHLFLFPPLSFSTASRWNSANATQLPLIPSLSFPPKRMFLSYRYDLTSHLPPPSPLPFSSGIFPPTPTCPSFPVYVL